MNGKFIEQVPCISPPDDNRLTQPSLAPTGPPWIADLVVRGGAPYRSFAWMRGALRRGTALSDAVAFFPEVPEEFQAEYEATVRRVAAALNLVEGVPTEDLETLAAQDFHLPVDGGDVHLALVMDTVAQKRRENDAALDHARQHLGDADPITIRLAAIAEERLNYWYYLRSLRIALFGRRPG